MGCSEVGSCRVSRRVHRSVRTGACDADHAAATGRSGQRTGRSRPDAGALIGRCRCSGRSARGCDQATCQAREETGQSRRESCKEKDKRRIVLVSTDSCRKDRGRYVSPLALSRIPVPCLRKRLRCRCRTRNADTLGAEASFRDSEDTPSPPAQRAFDVYVGHDLLRATFDTWVQPQRLLQTQPLSDGSGSQGGKFSHQARVDQDPGSR